MRRFGPDRIWRASRVAVFAITMLTAVAMTLAATSLATASSPTAHWTVTSQSGPSFFRSGDGADFYEIVAMNDGSVPTAGPITITDHLPPGLVVGEGGVSGYAEVTGISNFTNEPFAEPCKETTEEGEVTVTCTTNSAVPVGRLVNMHVVVQVPGGVSGTLANEVTIAGGGAQEAKATNRTPATESGLPIPFGASLTSDITDASGVDTQAGSHPFAFTTLVAFNVAKANVTLNAQARDVEVALPPGFVGNPTAIPYCTQAQFEVSNESCPASSQVGGVYLYFYGDQTAEQYAPVYNIEPPPGQPGELGFTISTLAHISMYFHVRSDGDYGLTADISDINQFDPVRVAALSIWGVPSDEAHDPLRLTELEVCEPSRGGCPSGVSAPKPFLRTPTSCTEGPLGIPLAGDSWQEPKTPKLTAQFPSLGRTLPVLDAGSSIAGMTGCDALQFHPSLSVESSSHQAGAPAGYDVDLKVPQHEAIDELATPDVRDVEVTLPEGTTVSPAAANGLTACSEARFKLNDRTKGECLGSSKIGSVKITTPLLQDPVKGALYIGEPECSPCTPDQAASGQMVRLLLEAEGAGVIIKLVGHTKINQSTGQLTAVFTNNPQLPFSDLVVSLEQGPSAPLVNPSTCGGAITAARVTPWSSMSVSSISAPAVPVEGCGTPGFGPDFKAGSTTSSRAGAFTGLAVSLSRNDGEQTFGRVSVSTPPGLLGVLKNVEQCPEAQANAGSCSAGSQIGTGSIVLGPGSSPLTITGSRVYLTGPYAGQPFGLSIVTPAVAGPFVLSGNTGNGVEVVRASIAIDRHTSALTVTSDPLPQELNGVQLDIRKIDIDVDRERFVFNPTSCDAMSLTGLITSAGGTAHNVAYPFQSKDCATLPFKPRFTATTQGKTSKKYGASLRVNVISGAGQANIAKVKVNLPIQLPSRNSTLQKACVDSVFEANPASCSPESIVGQATAVTPLLKNPLRGPAYLVSHAGRGFPDLEIILQGEGITLVLVGNTDIKKGVTSSTFKTIPDAPVSSFGLVLPEGPHSVLAAFGSLCTGKLKMPTVITGQNGAVIKQTTKIAATGCPKHRTAKKKA